MYALHFELVFWTFYCNPYQSILHAGFKGIILELRLCVLMQFKKK